VEETLESELGGETADVAGVGCCWFSGGSVEMSHMVVQQKISDPNKMR
jgi:hypothetical protein